MEFKSSSNSAAAMTKSVVVDKHIINEVANGSGNVGGRKSEDEVVLELVAVSSDELSSEDLTIEEWDTVSDEEEEEDDYSDDEEDEDETEEVERQQILKEMKGLKAMADFFAHPEKSIVVDGFSGGRNYFARPSAPEYWSEETQEEAQSILEDLQALKETARFFRHPESPLVVEATATARSFFSQPWAFQQESFAASEERYRAIEVARDVSRRVTVYQHPELPLPQSTNPFATGRNYFSRPSAEGQQMESQEYHDKIIEDLRRLKSFARFFHHPELPLDVDPNTFGRNFFDKASAQAREEDEYGDEREIVLEEMKELKAAAVLYRHPEVELRANIDPTCFGRNYFSRPSADEHVADSLERDAVLSDCHALKSLTAVYRHPEDPLQVDSTTFARNYFSRHTASEQEDCPSECDLVLADAAALKKQANQFQHPELPLHVDATASARSYFSRPSAEEQDEMVLEKELILQDASMLKHNAHTYRHPERPLTIDPMCLGRNYFSRPSAEDQSTIVDLEEQEQIAADVLALKAQITSFYHPELPVVGSACGRNYFSRASAIEQETLEDSQEKARILEDARALKKLAVDYKHPERPVLLTDPAACGRNYFSRASAKGASNLVRCKEFAIPLDSSNIDYGHFDLDVEDDLEFNNMRSTLLLPKVSSKIQSSKLSAEEEGELSRSPSSVMLFTGALDDTDHPTLPSMG